MWESALQPIDDHPLLVFAGGGSRSRQSRLHRFCQWHHETGRAWYKPDLATWRDQLIDGENLSASTARAYLSSVRSAYRHLLRSNDARQWLYAGLDADLSPERKWALIGEFTTQLRNAIDPANAPVSVLTVQDEDDTAHIWLTPARVAALVQAPGLDTWKGLRDTALIAMLLCTGIRAAEATDLEVADLRATLGGSLALKVRSGKGNKQRLIPYGAQDWGLTLTEAWLEAAGITQGPIFVGLRKGDNFYLDSDGEPQAISVRSVEVALASYPVSIHGELETVTPHDLRRTYARQLYLIGTDLVAIQQNLGHDRQETTLNYVGTLDADQRAPDDAYGTAWLQTVWDELAQRRPTDDHADRPAITRENPGDWHPSPVISPRQDVGGYVFKIWIDELQPLIWRRFKVPTGISFHTLHTVIQTVMGWEHFHLYRFDVDGLGLTSQPLGWSDRSSSELIDAYLQQPDTQWFYVYDFGDMWGHVIELEKHLVRPVMVPRCTGGNRACPPEDCGGPWVYDEFLRSRTKRKGRVSPKWHHHIGRYWDADAFDRQQVNEELATYWDADR